MIAASHCVSGRSAVASKMSISPAKLKRLPGLAVLDFKQAPHFKEPQPAAAKAEMYKLQPNDNILPLRRPERFAATSSLDLPGF